MSLGTITTNVINDGGGGKVDELSTLDAESIYNTTTDQPYHQKCPSHLLKIQNDRVSKKIFRQRRRMDEMVGAAVIEEISQILRVSNYK